MADDQATQHVILLHGLASSSILFYPMTKRLREQGFQTRTWGYFSFRGSIEKHAARFVRFLNQYPCGPNDTIHLVGHSMGSIIIRRALLNSDVPANIGRFVMIGPPNQGSHVATRFAKYLGWLCPALNELSDRDGSYVRLLGEPERCEVGIVQAERDLVVRDEYAKLDAATDSVCLPGLHTTVLFGKDAAENVGAYLKTGAFIATDERAAT